MKTSMRGFTLIELLVVIAIIAILSSIVITNLTSSKAKARDAKRVSDVSQIQLAIEQYFDRCQQYPSAITNPTSGVTSATCPSGVNLSNFISQVPTDPSSGSIYDYATYTPNGALGPTDYLLHTQLETNSQSLKDSLASSPAATTPQWFPANALPINISWHCANTSATSAPYDYCIGSR